MNPPEESYGTVHLTDWISTPRGQVKGLRGMVTVKSDEDHVGFRARGHNSANWVAVITGATQTWHVFGCQVRAISEHPEDANDMVDCWTIQ